MPDRGRTPREQALRALLRACLRLPIPFRGAVLGAPRRNDRGDALDADLQLMLGLEGLQSQELSTLEPDQARARHESSCRIVAGGSPMLERVHDLEVAGRPARLYGPPGIGPSAPLLVFLHGGGWVVGSLRSYDPLCRRLAVEGEQLVLSMDYRLAPEHPFPQGLDDALASIRWVREHAASLGADPARVAVGGDSAGGNLAASVCLLLREASEAQPVFQLLIYPATDLRRCTPSHRALGEGYLLTQRSLDWYQGHYAPDLLDPRASPLLAADHRGLAPAIIATAGFDPLRDDGERYARALEGDGVEVVALPFPSLVHGFASMDGAIPAASHAVTRIARSCAAMWRR